MTDTRALAAQALADVALRGTSLREAMERHAPKLADARDRALLMALLSDGARWWLRFDPVLDRLLEKSLRQKEPVVHALLVLGLVQLEILEMPAYAAVAATVQATRALQRPRMAGLVNAVLRRWQRERETLLAELDAKPQTRHAHPVWLAKMLARDWPEQADAVMAADNVEPPLMLRVNHRRTERDSLIDRLRSDGYTADAHAWLDDGIVLPHSTDVTRLPGFAAGEFAVQDGAAQIAADLADVRDGQRVLDACAAPGGKACHLLERASVALTALEFDAKRTQRISQNLERLGLDAQHRCRRCRRAGGLVGWQALRSHPDRRAVLGCRRAAPPTRCTPASSRERPRATRRTTTTHSCRPVAPAGAGRSAGLHHLLDVAC